jgi:hypothetical protein
MTEWVAWFHYQLQASADGLLWAFSQIPTRLRDQLPPDPAYLGTWTPVRHVWHITEYERCLVLPSMRQWLGEAMPDDDAWPDDDDAWAGVEDRSYAALSANFRTIRQQQIELLGQLVDVDWLAARATLWGHKPLSMIVTKTFQHTYEHGDTLLRMGLWWEAILEQMAQHAADADD